MGHQVQLGGDQDFWRAGQSRGEILCCFGAAEEWGERKQGGGPVLGPREAARAGHGSEGWG